MFDWAPPRVLVCLLACLLALSLFQPPNHNPPHHHKLTPSLGVLVSSHVDRWERGDMTTREISTLTNHPDPRRNLFCTKILGGRQQTFVLLRVVCLMLMKARAEKLKTKLVFLVPDNYTVDEEVIFLLSFLSSFLSFDSLVTSCLIS